MEAEKEQESVMMIMTERKAYGEMKRIYLSQHLLNHGN